jgi:hypothetical protein
MVGDHATRTSPKLEETQAPTKGKSFLHLIKHPPCNTDLTKTVRSVLHGGCFMRCRNDFPFVGACVSSSFSEVRVAHNTKMMSNTNLTKTGGNTGSHEEKVVPASYKAPTMLLI